MRFNTLIMMFGMVHLAIKRTLLPVTIINRSIFYCQVYMQSQTVHTVCTDCTVLAGSTYRLFYSYSRYFSLIYVSGYGTSCTCT